MYLIELKVKFKKLFRVFLINLKYIQTEFEHFMDFSIKYE